MGSIQGSLLPKVDIFARPWRDLAIRVRVRWARGRGCSMPRQLGNGRSESGWGTYLLAGRIIGG
jgi:hypothetical protein